MARGGERPGAGRKPGGIADSRRRLVAGMERGLARAARLAGCTAETEDELVVEAVADIAAGMIASGSGADLVKLYGAMAYSEPKGGNGPDEGSALERAMRRLPGLAGGTASAPIARASQQPQAESTGYETGTTDIASDVPGKKAPPKHLFPRQGALLDGLTGRPVADGER